MPQTNQPQPVIVQRPASQETKQHPDYDSHQFYSGLIGGLVVGLFLGYYGHWLTIKRENSRDAKLRTRKAKDEFSVKISQISGAVDVRDFAGYYRNTKEQVRDAVFALKPFLCEAEASRLLKAWEEYDAMIASHWLNQKNEDQWAHDLLAKRLDNAPPPRAKPSAILKAHFDAFSAIAR